MICVICGKELCERNTTGYCRSCNNKRPETRKKNSSGVAKAHSEGRCYNFNAASRLLGTTRLVASRAQEILDNPDQEYPSQRLRNLLLYLGREEKCEICGLSEWRGQKLNVEIHHLIARNNNRPEFLQFLCPNCHSQTESYKGANAKKGKFDKEGISKEAIWVAYKLTKNVRQTLLDVGLDPKGMNYARVYSIIEEFSEKE